MSPGFVDGICRQVMLAAKECHLCFPLLIEFFLMINSKPFR